MELKQRQPGSDLRCMACMYEGPAGVNLVNIMRSLSMVTRSHDQGLETFQGPSQCGDGQACICKDLFPQAPKRVSPLSAVGASLL